MKIIPAIVLSIALVAYQIFALMYIEFTWYFCLIWIWVLIMYIPIFKILIIPAYLRIPFNAPRWYRIRVYKQIYANIDFGVRNPVRFRFDQYGLCEQFERCKVSVFKMDRFPELRVRKKACIRNEGGYNGYWFKDNKTRLKWLDRQIKRLQK